MENKGNVSFELNRKKSKILNDNTPDNEKSSKQENSPSEKLTHDCLIYIFHKLPICDRIRCERVCKRWREASRASWHDFKKLDLAEHTWGNAEPANVYFQQLPQVLKRCHCIINSLDLSLSSLYRTSGRQSYLYMLAICPNLTELNLKNVKLSLTLLKFLTKHCKKVEKLTLDRVTEGYEDFYLGSFLFPHLNLKCLNLCSMWYKFTGSCLGKLSTEYIEEISLYACSSLDCQQFANILPTMEKLHTLKLRRSILNNAYPDRNSHRERDVKLLLISLKNLQNLKFLDISENFSIIDDDSLNQLCPLRDKLTTLDISDTLVTDFGLSIVARSKSLKHLYIRNLASVTGVGLGSMPNLRTLDCHNCFYMEESHMINVLNNSEQLNFLNLSNCENITKNFINCAVTVMNCRENKYLKIALHGTRTCEDDVPTDTSSLKLDFSNSYSLR